MVATKQVAIRLDVDAIAALDAIAERLAATFPRATFNRSDIIRAAVDDYIRRNS